MSTWYAQSSPDLCMSSRFMLNWGGQLLFFFSLIVDYCTKCSGHKGYANVLTELRIYLGLTGRGIMLLKLGFTIRCLIYLTNLSGIASWVSLDKEGLLKGEGISHDHRFRVPDFGNLFVIF